MRHNGRRNSECRRTEIIRSYTRNAPGSVLIRCEQTWVLCTASWQEGVPSWRAGTGLGWVTAEYDMLPGATGERRARNRQKIDGRTQEIQRLIGRSLRAVVDLELLGENSVLIDCDVLQADGGTRTASITGAYVALCDAVRKALAKGWVTSSPVREPVAAISVGKVGGRLLVDLDYDEDVAAEVDMNVVMTGGGRFIELQGTAEKSTFSRDELDRLVRLATRGIKQMFQIQEKALSKRGKR